MTSLLRIPTILERSAMVKLSRIFNGYTITVSGTEVSHWWIPGNAGADVPCKPSIAISLLHSPFILWLFPVSTTIKIFYGQNSKNF